MKKAASVSFGFAADQGDASFECSLDASAFSPCSSPQRYSGVKRGSHTFQVRAFDAAGNVDLSPATYSFKVGKKKRRRRVY